MTSTLSSLHQSYLDRIRLLVSNDERFSALLGGGSLIHGGFDAYSDLDLVLLVEAKVYSNVMAERMTFAKSVGGLISAFTGEHVGEPRLLICLYGPELIHIDLKFVTKTDIDQRIERPCLLWAKDETVLLSRLDNAHIRWPDMDSRWFEERFWVWLHYGAAKMQRGEYYETLGMLAFIREQVLGPMLMRRAGKPQRGVRRIESIDSANRLEPTLAGLNRQEISAALIACLNLYLDLREDVPPPHKTPHMPDAVVPYLS